MSANWEQVTDLRPTWVSLLVSQAIYLFTESESHDKTHELQNLKEIMKILMKILLKSNSIMSPDDKADLRNAIESNKKNKPDNKKNGLKIVEDKDLDNWKSAF